MDESDLTEANMSGNHCVDLEDVRFLIVKTILDEFKEIRLVTFNYLIEKLVDDLNYLDL